ncbi:MAG: hypothetical protein H6719_24825 [Sandaracinaceae bacterium]|nr:hypothetical protein [Sandaracinaceae bacterium]
MLPEPRARDAGFELVTTTPADRYFDYCLQPYRPRRPVRGKLRSENLLLAALEMAGLLEPARPVIEALRASLGRDMVVFGVKHDGARFFFELYVYDPQKEEPAATVSGLAATLAEVLPITVPVRETIPYMMVSFDLDAEVLARGAVTELNLYLTGSDAHAGRSYVVTEAGAELANTYAFLPPKPEIDAVLRLLESSMFVDFAADPRTLSKVLFPDLFACKRVCVSKKRVRDGIYYSGVDVDALLSFLRRFAWPAPFVDFVSAHAGRLDHVFFDVGVDYEPDGAGGVRYPKTSLYGTF